jgi:nucleotide-binding universal stress UspA family protein
MADFRRILVATDGSASCEGAIERAIELSACLGAELVVLSVAPAGDVTASDLDAASDPLGAAEEATMALSRRSSRPAVDEAVERATSAAARCAAAGVPARPVVWEGPAADSVLAAADREGVDIIVVGSHCRGGVGRLLLGSVSDHVVRHARVPVMVVPPAAAAPAGPAEAAATAR